MEPDRQVVRDFFSKVDLRGDENSVSSCFHKQGQIQQTVRGFVKNREFIIFSL
jgi:hypothetical protein